MVPGEHVCLVFFSSVEEIYSEGARELKRDGRTYRRPQVAGDDGAAVVTIDLIDRASHLFQRLVHNVYIPNDALEKSDLVFFLFVKDRGGSSAVLKRGCASKQRK